MANPLAAIPCAALMFAWLAVRYQHAAAAEAAQRIEQAVKQLLAVRSCLIDDWGGSASTSDVAEALCTARSRPRAA